MDFTPVPGGRMFAIIIKHPLSEIIAYVDWGAYLDVLQTTAISSVWVNPVATDLVIAWPTFSARVASIEIAGGSGDYPHIVENRIDCADGSKAVFRLSVYVNGASAQ